MSYICPRCHYETGFICNIKKHLNRKKICEAIYDDIQVNDILLKYQNDKNIEKKYQCEYCDKNFNSKQGKYQHKQICKNKGKTIIDESDKIIKMQEEINQLKELISHQPTTIINNNVTNIQNIQQNNQQNNIVIENFCKEDVEFISDNFIRKCLSRVTYGFEDLTKKIHFNPNKPEYHNVTIVNKKDPYLEVFKDNKWQFQDKNIVLDALIKQCFDILSSHYDRYEGEIKAQFSYTQLKQVDQLVDNLYNKDKSTQSKLRQYLYLVILNNRNIAKEKI